MKPVNCRNFGLFDNIFKRKNTPEDKPPADKKKEKEPEKTAKEIEENQEEVK